jgi:hypothetical protein
MELERKENIEKAKNKLVKNKIILYIITLIIRS